MFTKNKKLKFITINFDFINKTDQSWSPLLYILVSLLMCPLDCTLYYYSTLVIVVPLNDALSVRNLIPAYIMVHYAIIY